MQMTDDVFKKIERRPDPFDRALDGYRSQAKKNQNSVRLSENDTKEKVISFRVTEQQYQSLMDRFGDPKGIRSVLLSEDKRGLHAIDIQETSELIALDD